MVKDNAHNDKKRQKDSRMDAAGDGTRVQAPSGTGRGGPSRRQDLLLAAAKLFTRKGYAGTSVRDIARAAGMLPGSIYYHFPSKEALLVAVHHQGVELFRSAVEEALAKAPAEPWLRFEGACEAHMQALLEGSEYTQVVTPEFSNKLSAKVRTKMIADRDEYEAIFIELIGALPVTGTVDRTLFRLMLFGSLNWSIHWYRPGGHSPRQIARYFVHFLRKGIDG